LKQIPIASIYGIRRSGNHAITEWLLHFISGGKPRHIIKHRLITRGNSCYLNALNEYQDKDELRIDIDFCSQTFRNTLLTYEDTSISYRSRHDNSNTKIVIIRDIFNVAASRLQRLSIQGLPWDTKNHYMSVTEEFIQLWINHALASTAVNDNSRFISIVFDKWLCSREYRDRIAKQLGFNNLDCTSTVSHHGGGSSFDEGLSIPSAQSLQLRMKQVDFPIALKNRLLAGDIALLRQRLHLKGSIR
tara:strand:- start:278 stop:1015 length:738 start_codon:yes stop_codon:yes gene_type:complete